MSRVLDGVEFLVRQAVREILDSYGVEKSLVDATPLRSSRICLGSVGFASPELRGSILCVGPRETWKALYIRGFDDPTMAAEPSEEALCDTAGEFTGMVVGNFKRALESYGHSITLTTPLAVGGLVVRYPEPVGSISRLIAYETSLGLLHARLDASIGDAFELPARPQSDHSPVGSLLLL